MAAFGEGRLSVRATWPRREEGLIKLTACVSRGELTCLAGIEALPRLGLVGCQCRVFAGFRFTVPRRLT
jgi:hypothetical protein